MKFAAALVFFFLIPQSVQPETLGESVFIGQAYPSGNVYLRPFAGDAKTRSFWPNAVSLIDVRGVRRGTFDRLLESRAENDVLKSIYIPGAEGVDADHDPCGLGDIKPERTDVQILSADFFRTIIDHCEPNGGIALYRTAPTNYSVMVIGFRDGVTPANYKMNTPGLIFEGSTKEGGLALRITSRDSSGNAGHLSTLYTLDVLRSGQLVKRFEISQVQGPL